MPPRPRPVPPPSVDRAAISKLEFRNPGADPCARLAAVSLPLPLGAAGIEGVAGLATQAVDVGWWPDSRSGGKSVPRRRLLFAMGRGPLPATLRPGKAARPGRAPAKVSVEVVTVHKDHASMIPHEVGELRFSAGGRSVGLRLGARWKDETHWWEWLKLETLWSGPVVTAYRAAGCVETEPLTFEKFLTHPKHPPAEAILRSPWIHRQHWLFAEVFVLCFANGVVQLTCRHVNGHRFDEGRVQEDTVPILGFSAPGPDGGDAVLDGSRSRFSLGGVALELADAMPFVSPEHPGALRREGDLVVYQPYEGVEIAGDSTHRAREDGFIVRAAEKRIPKGVARSVRFALGLGEDAPVVSRLVVPEWWYAMSGDLWPDGALPAHDAWDARVEATQARAIKDHPGRFDEGILGSKWEGEVPYSQLLHFYRSGDLREWRFALRDAYHVADLAYDHSTETIRMHDYPMDGTTAPPLFRSLGMLFGHLETGDPYLRECAETLSSRWYWMDRAAWPRQSYGRDAASIRGLVFLWDYTGREDYRAMAREAMGRLIRCQLPHGGYGDQGCGCGVHAVSHLPVKVWMANLANDPILDYLERAGDDEELRRSFLRYVGFVASEAIWEDGVPWWPYQSFYGEGRFDPWGEFRRKGAGKLPTGHRFAHGHKARALNFATRLTGQPRWFDLWLKFMSRHWGPGDFLPTDTPYHLYNKTMQHLPYAQAHSWNARWRGGRLEVAPLLSSARPEMEATISTPLGPAKLRARRRRGRAEVEVLDGPPGLKVKLAPRAGLFHPR